VGFLSQLFGRTPSRTASATSVHASQLVAVVGESYRQDALRRISGTGSGPYLAELSGHALKRAQKPGPNERWFRAALFCERDNEYDENAIAVHADGAGHIGYLSRDDAIEYQPVFAALEALGSSVAACPAFLIGGEPGKPSYGAMLCLSNPERIVRDLAEG
jgi:hypothetical protein